jgi:hypothetical protein
MKRNLRQNLVEQNVQSADIGAQCVESRGTTRVQAATSRLGSWRPAERLCVKKNLHPRAVEALHTDPLCSSEGRRAYPCPPRGRKRGKLPLRHGGGHVNCTHAVIDLGSLLRRPRQCIGAGHDSF